VLHYPHISTRRGQCSSLLRPSSFVTRGTNRQKLPVGVISTTTRFGRYSCSLRDRFCNLSAPSSWRAVKGSKEAKYNFEAGSRSSREGWVSSSRPGSDPRRCGGGFEVDMGSEREERGRWPTTRLLLWLRLPAKAGELRSRGRFSEADQFLVSVSSHRSPGGARVPFHPERCS